MSRTSHVPSPQGKQPLAELTTLSRRDPNSDDHIHLVTSAVAQTVSNNQNTILGLASDLSGLEERIRSLADYYR